jgi:hypothetical protein
MARELGELFEYRIGQPVTIRKNESAMLPFLQQPIEARNADLFRSQLAASHQRRRTGNSTARCRWRPSRSTTAASTAARPLETLKRASGG